MLSPRFIIALVATTLTVLIVQLVSIFADEVLSHGITGFLGIGAGSVQQFINSTFAPGFALAAGMIAVVNPCGFGMLPAWMGLYLSSQREENQSPAQKLLDSLRVGCIITLGFIVLFGIAGLLIGVGFRAVIEWFPWLGFFVGMSLIFVSSLMVSGYNLYSPLPQRLSGAIGNNRNRNVIGYFAFGISYGIASLSCTLPIFLVVVATSLASAGFKESVTQFFWYALGMGSIIFILTLSLSMMRGLLVAFSQKVNRFIVWVSPLLMYLSGIYIILYWTTFGELL